MISSTADTSAVGNLLGAYLTKGGKPPKAKIQAGGSEGASQAGSEAASEGGEGKAVAKARGNRPPRRPGGEPNAGSQSVLSTSNAPASAAGNLLAGLVDKKGQGRKRPAQTKGTPSTVDGAV